MENKKNLLTFGIIAGPFFVISSFLHGLVRPGFDPVRQPASLLSLGEFGWIQIATFVITGILFILSSFGLKKALKVLFFIIGLAFISGGVFLADPALGFPPGTPLGVPKSMSWHSMVHGFAPIIGSIALTAAIIILGKQLASQGKKSWLWISIIIAVLTLILSSMSSFTANWETGQFNFVPLWLGVALGYGYVSILLVKLKKSHS